MRTGTIGSAYLSKRQREFIYLPGMKMAKMVSVTVNRYIAMLEPALDRMEREFRTELPFLAAISPKTFEDEGVLSAVLSRALMVDGALYPPEISRRTLVSRLESLTALDATALAILVERFNAEPQQEEPGVFDKALEATGRRA